MEILLWDGHTPMPKQVFHKSHCFNVPVATTDENDEAANKLISEITGGPGETGLLVLIICPFGNDGSYKLALGDRKLRKCNVMKNLRERFQDRVVLSVEIHSKNPELESDSSSDYSSDSEGEDESEKRSSRSSSDFNFCCASSKGMIIEPTKFTCSAHTSFMTKFDLNGLSKKSLFRIRLVAHVYDPNLSMSTRTNARILENQVASDVIIIAGNGNIIKSHKCFLASTSSVLQRMLESEMQESKTGRIDMTDISEEGIRAFLRFIYQGEVIGQKENIDVAYNLLYAAHKYDVPKLEEMMMTHLLGREDQDFSSTLAFKIYSFARGIKSASELKEKAVRIMSMKFSEIEELPEFKEVFQKNPDDALEFCRNLAMVKTSLLDKRKLDSEESGSVKKCKCLETEKRISKP